jgi:hypothetical protein
MRLALIAALLAFGQVKPPTGSIWKDTLDAAKADGKRRGVPVLLYVAADDGTSKSMTQALEDVAAVRVLRHFACAFVSRDYDKPKFQAAYVPWIGKTADTTHRPPLLVFGDAQGTVKQEYRVEGKSLSTAEIAKHLEKVLAALAPAEMQLYRGGVLEKASLSDLVPLLEDSLDQIEGALAPERLVGFREETAWAGKIVKSAEGKLKELKEKEDRDAATARLKELKEQIGQLEKYKGKDDEKFKAPLGKARDALNALKEIAGPRK